VPSCVACGKPGIERFDTPSAFVFRVGTASVATSSRSYGCFIRAGGGEISSKTDSLWFVMSR
jgi:hypothetical protein